MARRGLVTLAGLAISAIGSSAFAYDVHIDDPAWGRTGSGGAFRATHIPGGGYIGQYGGPGGSATSFLTFCMEGNENLNAPGDNYYGEIADSALNGGLGGGSPDPLDSLTATLYAEFRGANSFGALASLGGNGVTSAVESAALQLAIWYIEGERTFADLNATAVDLYNWAVANDTGSIGDVRVLRLWTNFDGTTYSGHAQDQLTIIPLPPAAWAGIGSLAGVALIGVVRRRKQLS